MKTKIKLNYATFLGGNFESRPSALRGRSEVIGKRQTSKINNDFSMAEKRETGGVLAWQSLQ